MRTSGHWSLLFLSGLCLFYPAPARAPMAELGPYKDMRLERLERFFESCQCPLKSMAAHFLLAADRNNLDWRLLPSLAFIESTGGKNYRNNNVLGWGCGRIAFASIGQGIHFVAGRLADSPLYRGKDLEGKLALYNGEPGYAEKVKAVMNRIDGLRGPAFGGQ